MAARYRHHDQAQQLDSILETYSLRPPPGKSSKRRTADQCARPPGDRRQRTYPQTGFCGILARNLTALPRSAVPASLSCGGNYGQHGKSRTQPH
jgi:hypothetical protein